MIIINNFYFSQSGDDKGSRAMGTKDSQIFYATKNQVKYKDDGNKSKDPDEVHESNFLVSVNTEQG
jgi:hypothetical protein